MTDGPEPFTIAPQAAVTDPTYNFGANWNAAIRAVNGVGSYAHYKRTGGGSTFTVQSYVPLVRAKCRMYNNYTNPEPYWEYPYLPQQGSSPDVFYGLPKQPLLNSSHVAVSWLVPNRTTSFSNGSASDTNPSAFLNLQIPPPVDHQNLGGFSSCSVDARWVNTTIVGSRFDPDVLGQYIVSAQMPNFLLGENSVGFPGEVDSIKASMDSDWLAALTPALIPEDVLSDVSVPGYNTLADLFQVSSLLNGHTIYDEMTPQIESMIATVVADGMSRVGYAANGGNITLSGLQSQILGRYNMSFNESSTWAKQVYQRGEKATTSFVQGYDASNSTYMRMNIFLQGYSYKADSLTYWLALALLYVHALLALGHLSYKLLWQMKNPVSSVAWDSPTDIIALAMVSEPPQGLDKLALRNTCGGADSLDTLAVRVGARVVVNSEGSALGTDSMPKAEEQVQLFLQNSIESEGLTKVEPGCSYGSRKVS